ncbi:hypothetical protein OG866_44205 [Streptomyces sp. NBC_00663]|uniref:hypothetical protein n=1 Tax=Streptomyces sp. NBC_00663 TaxID=2975801 RepID=UPI002E31A856|nr:hypothetical protein [Streptomyces sp. NBC_00663]
MLEQQLADKTGELEERTEELNAARAADRELTRTLNQGTAGVGDAVGRRHRP